MPSCVPKAYIKAIHPYQPGKPVEELERELGVSNAIKLASNENPWGFSSSIQQALIESINDIPLYPDANAYYLKQAIASHLSVNENQITIGNGSNDVLDLLARVYLGVGDEAIFSEYAFLVYPLVVQAVGATAKVSKALAVQADQHYGHDLSAMLELINDNTKMVFLANPNNPTGTYFTKEQLDGFLSQVPESVMVVLDEAYFEYVEPSDYPNGLDYISRYSNVVVTRTFSKIYGLASLRVGYAISHPDVCDMLNRVRQPFNANSFGLKAAQTSLSDTEFVSHCRDSNSTQLESFKAYLDAKNISYIPSVANFLTVNFGEKAADLYQKLLHKGIIVRPVANYGLNEFLRISMGTNEQMSSLKNTLDEILND